MSYDDKVIDCVDCLHFDIVNKYCELYKLDIITYHRDITEYKPCKLCSGNDFERVKGV